MYFTISSSKTLSHHDHDLAQVITANPLRNPSFPEDVIIAIRENWDASLFVAIGVRALWLWSAKTLKRSRDLSQISQNVHIPAAVIAKIFRSESSIIEHGENKEVIWKPDSSMIIVITSLGFLHFYTVDPQTSTKAFEYQFVRAHHYLAGAGQGKGIPNLPVKFKVSVKVEGGVQCGVCLTEELIVTTSKAPSIHTICLTNGEVNVTESKYLSEIIFLGIDKDSSEDNGTYLRQLIYSEDLNLFVWITSKGQAYLVKRFDAGGWGDNLAPEHDSAETPKRYYWAGIPIDIPVDPTAKSAAGLTRRSQAGMLPDADTAKRNFVICATFNSRFNLVTLGARDGNVYTYSIDTFSIDRFVPQSTSAFPDKSDLWFKFSHILKLTEQGSGYETHQLGTVSSLAYTWDGYALAVCWPGYGMAVFSVFGRKLITLNKNTVKEELSSPRDSKPGIKLEGYFDGVLHLFWGPGCYELYLLPTSARISTINDQLYVLPFARSGLTTANTLDNVRNPFLITEDRLFLYIGNHRELDTMKENVLLWHVIPLPPVYISENWPIKYSVVSQDGRYLAVAGKRGFAHYSVESGRWKLFGNSQQEKDVLCRGLVWYKNILIAAIQDASSLKCQLLFFSRDQKLDLSLAIHEEWLPHVTLLMNVCGPYLFIYTFDNVLTVFKLNLLHNGHHIQCELYIEIDMSDIVKQPKNVLSLAFFPDLLPGKTSNEFACIDNRPIMILMEGRLLLLDISSSGEQNQPSIEQKSNSYLMSLAERVEFFWLSINPVGNLKNSIWAFTEKYCMIFANVFLPGDSNFKSSEWRYHLPLENLTYAIDAVKFPLDFYPLTMSLTKGIISGVELWLSVKQSLECVTFSMTTKTHLFLSHIYENLLRRRLYDEAVEFATQYESLHYFAHSLEMLLHRVWEEEAETLVGFGSEAVLPQVIKFLEHFPNFLDVIVQCTRKTEISLWDYLFSIVGSPQDLFERCLNLGRLRTATSYLVIIHNMESSTVSGKDSVRLLEKVLEVEDFELLRELVRFLSSISNNSKSLWDRMPSIQNFTPYINSEASQSSGSISTMETQEPYMYLEIMVSRHARKLLQKGRIRALGKLSRVLDFPLTKWLRRERTRSTGVDDWSEAFASLHQQFVWPYPTDVVLPSTFAPTSPPDSSLSHNSTINVEPPDTSTAQQVSVSQVVPSASVASFVSTLSTASVPTAASSPPRRRYTIATNTLVEEEMSRISAIHASESSSALDSSLDLEAISLENKSSNITKRRALSFNVGRYRNAMGVGKAEVDEIRWLVDVMYNTGFYDWTLLLASMLFDIQKIVQVLEEPREELSSENVPSSNDGVNNEGTSRRGQAFIENWKNVLIGSSAGYQKLVQLVEPLLQEEESQIDAEKSIEREDDAASVLSEFDDDE